MRNWKAEIRDKVLNRFLEYVKINTQSDEKNPEVPSSKGQWELAEYIKKEMEVLGLSQIELDAYGYLYAVLPASAGVDLPAISFCAHFDTSPDASGEQVKAIIRKYEGQPLSYPDDDTLILDEKQCPELGHFLGEDIVTASGKTLLGADDKAGIAEIMTGLEILLQNPELKHPEIRVVFTPDEETGRGTQSINITKLGKIAYTFDGGMMGELEDECFNAWSVQMIFKGVIVHPGEAKNKMVNAAAIASRFISALPEWETPEHTSLREGFYHVSEINGDESLCTISMILRDFDESNNLKRIEYLKSAQKMFLQKYPGLEIDFQSKESYRNMHEVLVNFPEVSAIAEQAITNCGMDLIKRAIRGGTDGARLSFMGIPTPNIFAGGLLFHSKREWVPVIALEKAVLTMIEICRIWSEK